MKRLIGCGNIDGFIPEIAAQDKWDVIRELVSPLLAGNLVSDPELALSDLFARENSLSTGMTQGLAIPHARTDAVTRRCVVLGLSRKGIDFDSIDGSPSTIFFLTLTPAAGSWPDLERLAALSSAFSDRQWRQALLECDSMEQAVGVLERLG